MKRSFYTGIEGGGRQTDCTSEVHNTLIDLQQELSQKLQNRESTAHFYWKRPRSVFPLPLCAHTHTQTQTQTQTHTDRHRQTQTHTQTDTHTHTHRHTHTDTHTHRHTHRHTDTQHANYKTMPVRMHLPFPRDWVITRVGRKTLSQIIRKREEHCNLQRQKKHTLITA